MGVFQTNGQVRPHILQLLFINLVGWFFDIALAQVDVFAKAFESLDFPIEAITCIANVLVFGVTLIRGRLDLENGAREFLSTLRGPKLEEINGKVLTTIPMQGHTPGTTEGGGRDLRTASVVMLSEGTPNCSMKQFMESCAVDDMHSIVLQYQPLKNAMNDLNVAVGECSAGCKREGEGGGEAQGCNCTVFGTLEEITVMLDPRLPGAAKGLPGNRCLLPCQRCLRKGCYQQSLLVGTDHADAGVVYEILDDIRAGSTHAMGSICICIPMKDAQHDEWTNLLVRSFNTKDAQHRGVRVKALKALQEYVDGNGGGGSTEPVHYSIGSFLGPRISEILINLVLTFWFTVDGFSSSLAARRAVRKYVLDSEGRGLAASAFLTEATVKFDADNKHVFQVLTFRGDRFSFLTLSFIACGVNLICFIGWAVIIAFEGGDSAPPFSVARVVVIIAAIGIACFLDCLYMYSNKVFFQNPLDYKVLLVIISEITCIVAGSAVARFMGIKVLGTWVYSALQVLVWVKWAIGSDILDKYSQDSSGYKHDEWKVLVFSTAFLLNAALAGARSKWRPSWPWKENYLFHKH